MNSPIITASTKIQAPAEAVRDWFLALKTHPERYQFATHAGFEMLSGDFGEVGSRFRTQEKFSGVTIALTFLLTAVGKHSFRFEVQSPIPGRIWGEFLIEKERAGTTRLHLQVGSHTAIGRGILKLPLLHSAVRNQITGEVEHIKKSVESLL